MTFATPFFQGLGPLFFGPAVRLVLRQVARVGFLAELQALFGHLLPECSLAPARVGGGSRQRRFSTRTTFWAFVAQVLSPGTSCRESVRRVEAWWQAQACGVKSMPSVSTSAYCQARARLDLATLESIRAALCANLERHVRDDERGLASRPVKIVDGTCLSLPDTPANQALWLQPSGQQPGCGFPLLKLVGLFSLGCGALLASQSANLHTHESTLFRPLWPQLRAGDILLADRAFCSYAALAALRTQRGADTVVRLHQRRPVDFRRGQVLGPEDRLVTWQKPSQRPEAWSDAEFAALPPSLTLRLLRLRITARGYRTREVMLVTTLLDPVAYSGDVLRALYGRRWQVEGHFAQIKTSLGLDALRCKSPALIECEVLVRQIAYNLVRALMQCAAHDHRVPLTRLELPRHARHPAALVGPDRSSGQDPAPITKTHRANAGTDRRRPGARATRTQRTACPQTTRQKLPTAHPAETQNGLPAAPQPGEGKNAQTGLILAPFGTGLKISQRPIDLEAQRRLRK